MKQAWLDIKYDKEHYWNKLEAYLNPSEPLPKIEPAKDRAAVMNDLNIYANVIRSMRDDDLYGTPGAIIAEDIMLFLSLRSRYDANPSPYAWISAQHEPILSKIIDVVDPISIAENSTPNQWKELLDLISKLNTE